MHTLPNLPYDYAALEPYIDEATMKLHHGKHHQTYVDKLNAALEKYPELAAKSVEDLVRDLASVPDDIKIAVKNHGGGHYNHSLFWEMLAPYSGSEPKPEGLPADSGAGELAEAINKAFGDYDKFKEAFKNSSLAVFGSGWTWLVVDQDKSLKIVNTPNQGNPITVDPDRASQTPILGIDVWEHAYYLKYQNRRPEYVDNFFQIINWAKVSELYKKAVS